MSDEGIASRFRLLREALNETQSTFAQNLGIPRTTLINYEKGTSIPAELLVPLTSQYHVNIDWLLQGDGEMFIKPHDALDSKCVTVTHLPTEGSAPDQIEHAIQFENPPAAVPKTMPPRTLPAHRGFQVLNPRQLRQPRNLELYKYKKGKGVPVQTPLTTVDPQAVAFIPLFSQRAAAGLGQDSTQLEETEGLIPIVFDLFGLHRPESCGIVQVVGDSMTDISLFNGDWCIFDRVDIQGDGIFVISMYGEMRVKRLQYRLADRKIIIASENQKRYPDVEIVSAELATNGQLTIHGRVFAWFHKHPY